MPAKAFACTARPAVGSARYFYLYDPPAFGCCRPDRSLEFSLGHSGMEVRAGAGRRQHRHLQAGRAHPGHGGSARGNLRGGGIARGRFQHAGRLRLRGRRSHRQLARDSRDLFYRLQRNRRRPLCQSRAARRQSHMRDGRQKRGHRHGRRRPRQGRGGDSRRRLRFHRPALHGNLARDRQSGDQRRPRRTARGSGKENKDRPGLDETSTWDRRWTKNNGRRTSTISRSVKRKAPV
jgi:hypothetical protein